MAATTRLGNWRLRRGPRGAWPTSRFRASSPTSKGAGVLGGAAIALLAPFLGGPPGSAVSTGTGFVWTKSVLSGAEGTSVSLGALGRLKLDSGAISVTLAANWYGPLPSVDILFQFNDGQALTWS